MTVCRVGWVYHHNKKQTSSKNLTERFHSIRSDLTAKVWLYPDFLMRWVKPTLRDYMTI